MTDSRVRRSGDVVILDIPGSLRGAEVDRLRHELTEQRKEGRLKVILNASRLRRVHEGDMPILIRSLRSFGFVGGKLVLVGASRAMRNVLNRVGVTRFVNCFATEEDGLRFLGVDPQPPEVSDKSQARRESNNESDTKDEG